MKAPPITRRVEAFAVQPRRRDLRRLVGASTQTPAGASTSKETVFGRGLGNTRDRRKRGVTSTKSSLFVLSSVFSGPLTMALRGLTNPCAFRCSAPLFRPLFRGASKTEAILQIPGASTPRKREGAPAMIGNGETTRFVAGSAFLIELTGAGSRRSAASASIAASRSRRSCRRCRSAAAPTSRCRC